MDYKKIIKSRDLRLKILCLFSWIPDSTMLKIQYRIKMGRKLNLKNPERFTEKLQWYKINYRNPIMSKCVDKYEVREYVKSKGLENILNECYAVYASLDDVDFSKLPNKFVLKDTLGSGGNSVIVVNDKESSDLSVLKKKIGKWLNRGIEKVNPGREWVYCNQKHRVIAEKFLTQDDDDLVDYKFFCFNGNCEYLYVINGRKLGNYANFAIYNKDFELMPIRRCGEPSIEEKMPKPKNFDKMLEYAKILSKDFPHVRVDFYNINGKIIFGELTFFNASGFMKYDPDSFDYELGKQFEVKKN